MRKNLLSFLAIAILILSGVIVKGQNCQAFFAYQTCPTTGTVYFIDQSHSPNDTVPLDITSWLWDFGDGSSSTEQNPNHVFISNQALVCLTITTADSCTSTYCDSVLIENPDSCYLFVDGYVTNITNPTSCDGSIEIVVQGGTPPYSYLWDNGATSHYITNLCEGYYTVTVHDANQCHGISSFYISSFSNEMYLWFETVNVTDSGYCDGAAYVFVEGGQAPYYYVWSTGDTTPNIDGLCVGIYEITVYDALQNFATGTVHIQYGNNTGLIITSVTTNASNYNVCDGSVYIVVEGGTPPYYYYWGNGGVSDLNYCHNLCPGEYVVEVVDANGNSAAVSFYIGVAYQNLCSAYFTYYYEVLPSGEVGVHFFDNSFPGDSSIIYWNWDFGDGGTSSEQNPIHYFADQSYFQVCLTVHSPNLQCMDTYCEYLCFGDPNNVVTDTSVATVDTGVITAVVDTAYVNDIYSGNNCVYLEWIIIIGSDTVIIIPEYYINDTGCYYVTLFINCEGIKTFYAFSDIIQVEEEDLPLSATVPITEPVKVMLFPNPATDKVTLQLNSQNTGIKSVSVLNSVGQEVYTGTENVNTTANIDVSTFRQGLYIVNVHLDNGNSLFVKFIK